MQTASPTRNSTPRTGDFYAIESVIKAALVLEALEGTNFEPASLKEIARRARQNLNFTFRTLKSFEQVGFARRVKDRWQIGARLIAMANRSAAAFGS